VGQGLDNLSQEQRRHQDLLASLAYALRSFTNLGRFLELVPLVTSRLVGSQGALLVVFHQDGRLWRDHLQAFPADRWAGGLRQLAALPDSELGVWSGDPSGVADLDQRVGRLLGDGQVLGDGELLATSVVARSSQRGRLYVFAPRGELPWNEVQSLHLQLVADLAGVALEGDTLRQALQRHERVDRQLSIGAEIQAELLPNRCPLIEGVTVAARCRSAFEVGGDYYDFIPTQPQGSGPGPAAARWALVIGDVMGKGVPAGLLMALLRGMLRAEVLSGHAPDRILHDLNQLAQEDLAHSHRFMTLFYSDFDPRTRLLRYANAGHHPPLIWRRGTGQVERLDAPGVVIGLQPGADYDAGQTLLESGDVLLYFTDGVTEALGFRGERFEEHRLINQFQTACHGDLGAQEILNLLFARLDRFVGADRQLDDDASLVVLKVGDQQVLASLPS
jgi:sigma-B regulation protein RsbU (phosphoserine phosphatase)